MQETQRLVHHRSLYSRIGSRAQLEGLDRSAVEAYLVHGLAQVGLQRTCLAAASVDLLASATVAQVKPSCSSTTVCAALNQLTQQGLVVRAAKGYQPQPP